MAVVKIIDDIFDLLAPTIAVTSRINRNSFINHPSITLYSDGTDQDSTVRGVTFLESPSKTHMTNPPAGVPLGEAAQSRFS